MSTVAVRVSFAEYMNTAYEPDCEFIDGILEERNTGKKRHSRTQGLLVGWLLARQAKHGCQVLPEQRVRISANRVRIPDICLVPPDDSDEVVMRPPLLWVEILSPEDSWSRVQAKLREVQAFGVEAVWIIDPYSNEGWEARSGNPAILASKGVLSCESLGLELLLSEILSD